jgi:hypothetical protein
MSRNIELTEQAKRECAGALAKVLSDTFVLYLKTHNFHWNVEGPQFLGLHEMFEKQYRDLWNSIDDIAERIRALGQPAPGTTEKFKELAEIKENGRIPWKCCMNWSATTRRPRARFEPHFRRLRPRVTKRPLASLPIALPIMKSSCG